MFWPQKISKICFKEHCFNIELADSKEERRQGLMFREKMDAGKGMLFIFDKQGFYSFWMKNTLIPLDIIWINEDKKVVVISKNAQPCAPDECVSINPKKEARYVLELNAGIADKIGLKIGDKACFK